MQRQANHGRCRQPDSESCQTSAQCTHDDSSNVVTVVDPAVTRLRRVTPFRACTDFELQFIVRRSSEHRAAPGALLARKGATGREAGVIIEGSAMVLQDGRTVARLGPGDFFGEIAVLDHGTRIADVQAETDVVAVVCTDQEFRQIIDECPTVARELMVGLARRMRSSA